MKTIDSIVFDTNTLISAFLIHNSPAAKALDLVVNEARLVCSDECLLEFMEVIYREKFDKYFNKPNQRDKAVRLLKENAHFFRPSLIVKDCRDPKDNKFLELAIASKAAYIVTGDQDLLVLNPYKNTFILNPTDFLNVFNS